MDRGNYCTKEQITQKTHNSGLYCKSVQAKYFMTILINWYRWQPAVRHFAIRYSHCKILLNAITISMSIECSIHLLRVATLLWNSTSYYCGFFQWLLNLRQVVLHLMFVIKNDDWNDIYRQNIIIDYMLLFFYNCVIMK